MAPEFEKATGCRVTLEPRGSSADIVRNATSTSTDVFAVSGDSVLALAVAGAAATVPRGVDDDVVPAVRRAGERDGQHYGVPFVWGPEYILAARRAFPVPPTSYDALFDPAYAGQIAVPDDPFQIALAAVVLGTRDPYALDARDLDAAAELIRRQRPLVREYWTDPADLAAAVRRRPDRARPGARQGGRDLSGLGISASVPAGPVLGWSTWFVTAADAPHPRCAAKWRNYVLAPNVQITLARAAGGAPAVQAACAPRGAGRLRRRPPRRRGLPERAAGRADAAPADRDRRLGAGLERSAALAHPVDSPPRSGECGAAGAPGVLAVAGGNGQGGTPRMHRRWVTGTLVVCALALTAAACGDGDDPTGSAPGTTGGTVDHGPDRRPDRPGHPRRPDADVDRRRRGTPQSRRAARLRRRTPGSPRSRTRRAASSRRGSRPRRTRWCSSCTRGSTTASRPRATCRRASSSRATRRR